MQRTVVIRHSATTETNLNDEIGLEAYSDYSLRDYLEDQAREEGRAVVACEGMAHVFSDGEVEILEERKERIAVDRLDRETRSLVEAALVVPQGAQWSSALAVVC